MKEKTYEITKYLGDGEYMTIVKRVKYWRDSDGKRHQKTETIDVFDSDAEGFEKEDE